MSITKEDILFAVKCVFIAFGIFVVLAGIFVKSDDTQHNDPNNYPPVPPAN
jgi:hypothetical protein